MKFIDPLLITDAMLTASSLPETDHPAWSAGTAYTVGQLVIRTSVHRRFQRVVAGTTATPPESDVVNWLDIGPTNKWAPFDQAVGSVASSTSTITYTITPGRAITSLALLDLSADAVSITVTVGGVTAYSAAFDPVVSSTGVYDWFAYFFDSIERRGALVVTNMPAFSEAVISIAISGSGTLELGTLAIGNAYTIGTTLAGSKVEILDYSSKTTDAYGITTVVERGYAKRLSAQVVIQTPSASDVARRLAAVRSRPVVWIGEEDVDAALIYGWCREWAVELKYPTISYCSLAVDGLV